MNPTLKSVLEVTGVAAGGVFRLVRDHLRLRTKLLLSFFLLVACLTLATLLLVRRDAQNQAQLRIEREARNAVLVFQGMQRHQLVSLGRKADLLAWVASIRGGDAGTIEEASDDPWQSDDCNLFVLTDKTGRIVALHSALDADASPEMFAADTLQAVARYRQHGARTGWWFVGGNLYEVVLQTYSADPGAKGPVGGYVLVGRSADERTAADLARVTSSDIVFRFGQQVAVSTLTPLEEQQFQREFAAAQAAGTASGGLAAAEGARAGEADITVGGRRYFETPLPLTPGWPPEGELIALRSYADVDAYLARLNRLLLAIGLAAMLAGGTLIFFVSDTITRPIASLAKGVEALEGGDFAYPLNAAGEDETGTLTRAFDSMRHAMQSDQEQRAELERQLRQAQKMDALGRLAGGVAHDFNNLLTVIRGHSELMLGTLRPIDALFGNAQQICKTTDRATSLTRQLLAFSRMQVVQPKVLDLNDMIPDMGKLLRRLIREDIEFALRLGDSLGRVKADPGQMEQVLLNLTVNASDAMPHGGTLTIETQNMVVDREMARARPKTPQGKYVMLRVSDTGQGMNSETMARIFEPFFTTKEPGKGTGLGLATVYGVVKQSGGYIWVESEPGKGSRFEIYLPRTDEPLEMGFGAAMKKHETAGAAKKVVLVVEDERDVREITCEFLRAAGYSVLTAEDGQDALEIAERMGAAIDAVLTDVVMPRMRGPELGRRLREQMPKLRIVYMTGYLEPGEGGAEWMEEALFLQKPFSREALVSRMAEALGAQGSGSGDRAGSSIPRVPAMQN